MISELKIRNFKSLESVDLKPGHFNLLVGANASGKSNFLDALRFLQGIGNGLGLDEILDGKPPSDTTARWAGIRGGTKSVAFRKPDGAAAEKVGFHLTITDRETAQGDRDELIYDFSFRIANGGSAFGDEFLSRGTMRIARIMDSGNTVPRIVKSETGEDEVDVSKLNILTSYGLADIALKSAGYELEKLKIEGGDPKDRERRLEAIVRVSRALRDIQFLDPAPSVLRNYSSKVERMSESGEGFAALIHEIETNGSKPALLEWLKELRPDEVDDVYALEGLNNDFMVAIKEGNREFRAPVLSEGTLRFIALAAAFFQPSMPKVLVIEEIEKGLHPSRLRLLLELMRSQSKRTGTQVFATTHSPTLLNWLTEEDRKTTFVCTRDAESGATKMRSLAEVPNLEELIKKNYNLDQLFEEGWLESVLHES
jgi:AAA domain, putative AbiEii toxin, Type IV TA system/AAA ATPase domain